MSCKECRPWSDTTFCGIWSGSTLFAQVSLSQYLGLLQYLSLKILCFDNYENCYMYNNKKRNTNNIVWWHLSSALKKLHCKLGWAMRKLVLGLMRTSKVQISLCIRMVWSGPYRIIGYYRMYLNGEQRPRWYFAIVQDDLKLHILWLLEGTFFIWRSPFNPCPAEPGYTLPLQTV